MVGCVVSVLQVRNMANVLLSFSFMLWDPSTDFDRNMMKRVERKSLCHAAYKFNVICPPHNYTPIQRLFSLESLADHHRNSAHVSYLSNILFSKIDSPESLFRVSFNAGCYTIIRSIPYSVLILKLIYWTLRSSAQCIIMRISYTVPSFSL